MRPQTSPRCRQKFSTRNVSSRQLSPVAAVRKQQSAAHRLHLVCTRWWKKRVDLTTSKLLWAVLLSSLVLVVSDVYLQTNYSMIVFNMLKNGWLHRDCKPKEYSANVTRTVAGMCHSYNSQHTPYMLDFGTLLGAMRNGGVIPWDHDCDFSLIHFVQDQHAESNVHRRLQEKSRSQRCDHFHRTFTQSDVDNDKLCIYDFTTDGQAFNAVANLLSRRVPCKHLTETIDLAEVFPKSEWKHCKVPRQFNQILSHYYGAHWNSSWQENYQRCEDGE